MAESIPDPQSPPDPRTPAQRRLTEDELTYYPPEEASRVIEENRRKVREREQLRLERQRRRLAQGGDGDDA